MTGLPLCPKCGAIGIGERCGTCGTQMPKPGAAPAAEAPANVEHGGAKHRNASAYLSLQKSEEAVLHAASRIFAGFVASGAVTDDNQNAQADRSVKLATRMALVIEKYVQSDDEDW